MLTRRSVLWGSLALVALAYATGFGGEFLWDDLPLIVGDSRLRSWTHAWDVAMNPFWAGAPIAVSDVYASTYRPIVSLAYLVQVQLFGLEPAGFHIVSLVLHALCTWLFARWLMRRLPDAPPLALAIGIVLFALHPTRVETVAWVSGSPDLWMMLLVLGGLEAWDRGRAMAAGLMFSLAFFAKEGAIVVPVLLAIDAMCLESKRYPVRAWTGVAIMIAAAALVRNAIVPLGGGAKLLLDDLPARVLSTLGHLVTRIALPFPQTVHPALRQYDNTGSELFDPWSVAIGLVVVAAVVVLAVRAFRQRPQARKPLADIMWFIVPAAPTLNILDIDAITLASDRFLYWPMMGIAALATRALASALQHQRARTRIVAAAVIVIGLASLFATVTHVRHFASEQELWTHEVTVDDTNTHAWSTLADIAKEGGWKQDVNQFCKQGHDAARARRYSWEAIDFALCQLRTHMELTRDQDLETLLYIRDVYDQLVARGVLSAQRPPLEFQLGISNDVHRRRLVQDPALVAIPRAQAHLRTENLAEATTQLEQITRFFPRTLAGWSLLAQAYDKQGRPDKRDEALRQVQALAAPKRH